MTFHGVSAQGQGSQSPLKRLGRIEQLVQGLTVLWAEIFAKAKDYLVLSHELTIIAKLIGASSHSIAVPVEE